MKGKLIRLARCPDARVELIYAEEESIEGKKRKVLKWRERK